MDDDWQLVSAASGSSIPSTSSHQAEPRPTQPHSSHHQQIPPFKSLHQSPVKGSGEAQSFPELASLSNEALAALLVDDTKYGSLVGSIMARSSVAQVGGFLASATQDLNWKCCCSLFVCVLPYILFSFVFVSVVGNQCMAAVGLTSPVGRQSMRSTSLHGNTVGQVCPS